MAISTIHANLPVPVTDQIDRLSSLPKELLITILSFLPTHIAARTSVLSRHFRHLWEASPSVDLATKGFPQPHDQSFYNKFFAMVSRALFRRDPSHPLLSFCVDHFSSHRQLVWIFFRLIRKACSFSLRCFTIKDCLFTDLQHVLPVIFSIKSLESLSLPAIAPTYPWYTKCYVLPSATNLTSLTTLSIKMYTVHSDRNTKLEQLLSQLPSLQDLQLGVWNVKKINISSHTIRKFKLIMINGSVTFDILRLSLPMLGSLHLENYGRIVQFPTIHGEIPLLRKAVLNFEFLRDIDVRVVNGMLHYVSHAEELILHMKESMFEMNPFPVLLEQGEDPPNFSKLKHLDVTMCFHEDNFQAIVSMLPHCPALESVRLDHEAPKFTGAARKRKRRDWKSKLPRNADRNHRYAWFKNLHLSVNRKEFMKFLSKKCASKRQALDEDLHNRVK